MIAPSWIIFGVALSANGLAASVKSATYDERAEIVTHIQRARAAIDESDPANNPRFGWAFRRKRELEREMGLVDDTGALIRPPTEEDLKKISGGFFSKDRRGDYVRAQREVQEAQFFSDREYALAIRLTVKAYGIRPDEEDGHATNGAPWERGKWIPWNPLFNRYLFSSDEMEDRPGLIYNGNVYIHPTAFFNHASVGTFDQAARGAIQGDPDPGYLASILFHEAQHVDDFMSSPAQLDLRNEPAREIEHRLKQLANEEIFRVPSHDWLSDLKNLAWQFDLKKKWQETVLAGADPYDPVTRAQIFDRLQITPERARQINEQVNHDVETLFTAPIRYEPQELERLRHQAQSDFVRELSDGQLFSLIGAWKTAREVDAQRNVTNRAIFIAQIEQELLSCGFAPRYTPQLTLYFVGNSGNGLLSYEIAHPMTADQVHVGIMIAASCLAATRDARIIEPCNDGVEIAAANWADPEFRKALGFNAVPAQLRCMQAVIGGLNQPIDRDEYSRTVAKVVAAMRSPSKAPSDDRQQSDDAERRRREDEAAERRAEEHRQSRENQRASPGYGHPRGPGNCGFNDRGAYCN